MKVSFNCKLSLEDKSCICYYYRVSCEDRGPRLVAVFMTPDPSAYSQPDGSPQISLNAHLTQHKHKPNTTSAGLHLNVLNILMP
jgi:hypothetical protein